MYKKGIVGEKYLTNEGYIIEIIEYFGRNNCTIIFENGVILYNKDRSNIKKGEIKNPHHPSVCEVGYTGVGKYSNKQHKQAFEKWAGMLRRCYNEAERDKFIAYKGCLVVEHWYNFQNFAQWFENNYNSETMQGWALDKDILVKGNKVYSPETCCFTPSEVNNLFITRKNKRGNLPIGVTIEGKKYIGWLHKKSKTIYLGTFNTPEEAFQAYKTAKESYIKEIADKWKNQITEKVYQAMINYQVEITD